MTEQSDDIRGLATEAAGMGSSSTECPHEPARPTELNHRLITLSVMAATIMQALDTTIANVALPRMQGTLSATQDQMSWVLTSYIIASAIMIPLTGWLAGRFGRKKVFLISVAGFTISSALCGAATSLLEIVLFRLLQGISGAALVPLSQAILFDINPPERFARAMAMWGVGVTMGPILGPVLGGWLTENYSWHWVFYINVPIGILAFLGLSASMPDTTPHNERFDFFGFLTLSLGIASLQLMLDRGELKDWFSSIEIILEASLCAIGFYLFIIHTLTYSKPFLSPALFADRNFLTANLLIFIVGIVLFATLALIPPLLQHEMNYPVVTTGLVTAPRGAGTMLAMLMVGKLAGKIDPRLMIAAGFAATAYSLWEMTGYSLLMDEWPIVWVGVVQGFGIGLCFAPLSSVAFTTLPANLRNEGTAFFSLARNIGSAIGISAVQTLLTRNTQIFYAHLGENITPYTNAEMTSTSLSILSAKITREAAMIAYLNDFKFMMWISLAVLPLLFLLKRPPNAAATAVVMD